MSDHFLARLFEHNNWANLLIIHACSALTDAQLDAEPASATIGSLRLTLFHLVTSQQSYLRHLTLPLEERMQPVPRPPFADLELMARSSGEALVALARDPSRIVPGPIPTRDGYRVEPWVVMLQIINHASEHREQIKSMLTALGVTPPAIDGWDYGEFTGAMLPLEKAGPP